MIEKMIHKIETVSKENQLILLHCSVFFIVSLCVCSTLFAQEPLWYDFNKNTVTGRDAKFSVIKGANGESLRIDTQAQDDPSGSRTFPKSTKALNEYPGVNLGISDGPWDLSKYETISMDVTNLDDYGLIVRLLVNSEHNDKKMVASQSVWLDRYETRTLDISLNEIDGSLAKVTLAGIKHPPFWAKQSDVDVSHVVSFLVSTDDPSFRHRIVISNLHVHGKRTNIIPQKAFPFVDDFGQYMFKEWHGKIHSDTELKENIERERKDLENNPRPVSWDQYGGWADGPKLRATGYFRVENYEGKWWMVTPVGSLFFSQGPCVADTWSVVKVSGDRSEWFVPLPNKKFLLSPDNSSDKLFDYAGSNLYRKYGSDYKAKFFDVTQRRLASWGFNTLACWSNQFLCQQDEMPFVMYVRVASGAPLLEGYNFYDVFSPKYLEKLKEGIGKNVSQYTDDSWCIGYFLDNELRWGTNVNEIALAVLKSPDSESKRIFIDDLKIKYSAIEKLNLSWSTSYDSWDDMLKSKETPGISAARADLAAFYVKFVEKYFSSVREEIKSVDPNHLYLGCRFSGSGSNETVVRLAQKYTDVLSVNYYGPTVYTYLHQKNIEDLKGPILIGEFHFGALDRGLFSGGVSQCAKTQDERAIMYKRFVYEILSDPRFVGCHYFQYRDKPLTGDVAHNEDFQIGFVDIVDTPYSEMINTFRDIAKKMYEFRLQK